jgi:hypothetical protein
MTNGQIFADALSAWIIEPARPTIVFTGDFPSSPKAFIGDPVFLKKRLDSRPETLRE